MAVAMNAGATRHFLLPFLLSLMSPLCCRGQENLPLVTGDVTLGVILSVNNIQGQSECGDYDADSLRELTAIQWLVDSLNKKNYMPGVRLGLEAYRTCQSGERATSNTVRMLDKFRLFDDNDQTINTTTPLFGILGPGRTQEAIVVSRFLSSLPSGQRPLLISGSATGAALADRNLYSNFFRVIPPDSTQVQVLQKLLQKLGWNYIAIVYDDDAYGRESAHKLRELARAIDICVPSFAALPLDYTSQNFITTAEGIVDQLLTGSSSVVTGVVFIGSAATAKDFLSRLQKRSNFIHFIFSEALGLQTSVVFGTILGKGALAAAPPYLPLPEFRAFWNSIWTNWTVFSAEMKKNSWLAGYYTAKTKCSVSEYACWIQAYTQNLLPLIQDNTQWLFEYYDVKATAVFAAILKKLHANTCRVNNNGLCLQLKQVIRNDRGRIQQMVQTSTINLAAEFSNVSSIFSNQTNVGFTAQGEVTFGQNDTSLYDVFNYRECDNSNFCFQKVGSYMVGGELVLDTAKLRGYTDKGQALVWPNYPKSQCKANHDCLACLPPHLPDEVVFVPGDVYIVAVAPVHDKASNSPLQCGAIRASAGADFVQSVMFAVQKVNLKRAPFTGIFGTGKLGVVILNSCSRELVLKEKLIALHKGTLTLPDGRNSSQIVPKIGGYVGAFFSAVSVAMYEVLSSLDRRFVMLSPANTSPELSDRAKYPQYLRMTSGKDSQVRALLTLVRDLGHQYVQVIYNPDDVYALTLKESINNVSSHKSFNICVVNNIASDEEDTSFYPVLDNLRKNAWAPLVIVVLQSGHTQKVMKNILPQMSSSDTFRFLGTDAWARSSGILSVPDAKRLVGSLTYSIELPLDPLFQQYIGNIDPLNTANPWLKYFWEKRKSCYFDGSFQRAGKTAVCPSDLTRDYVQDTWVPFYIDAVYALALGLNTAMNTHCGPVSAQLCDALTSQRLVEAISGVRIDLSSSGVPVNVFDSNGDGDIGFKVYQVAFDETTANPNDVTYKVVGRFERESLTLDRGKLWILNNLPKSACPNTKACQTCFPPAPVSPNNDKQDEGMSGALIGTIVVIVLLIIAIIALVVVLALACRRLRARAGREANDQGEKFAFDNAASMGSRSGDSRPLPPIRGSNGSSQETSMGYSVSGGSHVQVNTYDYLQSDGPDPTRHSTHGYLQGGPLGGASAGSSPGSSTRAPVPLPRVNSAGYVSRQGDVRLGYEPTNPPYNRITSPPPPASALDGATPQGGTQNSRVGEWLQEGGQQNSRLEDSRGGSAGSRPVVFENPNESGGSFLPPPERCTSSGSDYLIPFSGDYLTPRVNTVTEL
ncbi:hypothetical protein ACOMHN_043788 [Nucella lapillus]